MPCTRINATTIKVLMMASSTVSDMEVDLGCYLGWDSRGSGWSNAAAAQFREAVSFGRGCQQAFNKW